MDRDRRKRRENDREPEWVLGSILGGIAGLALAGGLIYKLTRGGEENQERQRPASPQRTHLQGSSSNYNSTGDYFIPESSKGRVGSVPESPSVTNLDSLLDAIYVRYVSVKYNEFQMYYEILMDIFNNLHNTMKSVDRYYERFSSSIMFAGSHFDGARIERPDEFDLDVVIRMPVNYSVDYLYPSNSDVNIEPQEPGFLQLRMGRQFLNLPNRDEWDINKTAYKWMDENKYLRRSKFLDWFKGVVDKALNTYPKNWRGIPTRQIDGQVFSIFRSESGPAITLTIKNNEATFKMDFDLVPALRFPEARWPDTDDYREISPSMSKQYWLVVPKPNTKSPQGGDSAARSWRCAMQNQEQTLLYNRNNLKQALRLMKKLRDAREMKDLSSYYIKTLFFWEVVNHQTDPFYWRQSTSKLFKIMVKRLHDALCVGKIPYFWNSNNNLLSNVRSTVISIYIRTLKDLMVVLEDKNNYKRVASFLLTPAELQDFNSRCSYMQHLLGTR